jgi:hypothetical protein
MARASATSADMLPDAGFIGNSCQVSSMEFAFRKFLSVKLLNVRLSPQIGEDSPT